MTHNETRLLDMLQTVMGQIDFTNHCCDPFTMVAAAMPVEVLDDANALIVEMRTKPDALP